MFNNRQKSPARLAPPIVPRNDSAGNLSQLSGTSSPDYMTAAPMLGYTPTSNRRQSLQRQTAVDQRWVALVRGSAADHLSHLITLLEHIHKLEEENGALSRRCHYVETVNSLLGGEKELRGSMQASAENIAISRISTTAGPTNQGGHNATIPPAGHHSIALTPTGHHNTTLPPPHRSGATATQNRNSQLLRPRGDRDGSLDGDTSDGCCTSTELTAIKQRQKKSAQSSITKAASKAATRVTKALFSSGKRKTTSFNSQANTTDPSDSRSRFNMRSQSVCTSNPLLTVSAETLNSDKDVPSSSATTSEAAQPIRTSSSPTEDRVLLERSHEVCELDRLLETQKQGSDDISIISVEARRQSAPCSAAARLDDVRPRAFSLGTPRSRWMTIRSKWSRRTARPVSRENSMRGVTGGLPGRDRTEGQTSGAEADWSSKEQSSRDDTRKHDSLLDVHFGETTTARPSTATIRRRGSSTLKLLSLPPTWLERVTSLVHKSQTELDELSLEWTFEHFDVITELLAAAELKKNVLSGPMATLVAISRRLCSQLRGVSEQSANLQRESLQLIRQLAEMLQTNECGITRGGRRKLRRWNSYTGNLAAQPYGSQLLPSVLEPVAKDLIAELPQTRADLNTLAEELRATTRRRTQDEAPVAENTEHKVHTLTATTEKYDENTGKSPPQTPVALVERDSPATPSGESQNSSPSPRLYKSFSIGTDDSPHEALLPSEADLKTRRATISEGVSSNSSQDTTPSRGSSSLRRRRVSGTARLGSSGALSIAPQSCSTPFANNTSVLCWSSTSINRQMTGASRPADPDTLSCRSLAATPHSRKSSRQFSQRLDQMFNSSVYTRNRRGYYSFQDMLRSNSTLSCTATTPPQPPPPGRKFSDLNSSAPVLTARRASSNSSDDDRTDAAQSPGRLLLPSRSVGSRLKDFFGRSRSRSPAVTSSHEPAVMTSHETATPRASSSAAALPPTGQHGSGKMKSFFSLRKPSSSS